MRRSACGELNSNSKLTEREVLEIRSKRSSTTIRKLAKEYGVTQYCIIQVCGGYRWKHLLDQVK